MEIDVHPDTARSKEGAVRPVRFLLATAPATVIALLMLPAIYFGWISIAIAAEHPIEIVTPHGEGQWLYLASSTNGAVTGVDNSPSASQEAAIIHVLNTQMDGMCLSPEVDLPFVSGDVRLFINIGGTVHIGDVTLAATKGYTSHLNMPRTSLGVVDGGSGVPGAPSPGAFTVQTDKSSGGVTFDDLSAKTYGLVVKDGMQPKTLKFSTGGGGC